MTAQAVERLFARRGFETVLGGLILVSAALTVVEIATPATRTWAVWTVQVISALFALELVIRWRIAVSTRRFFREYWIDCLSVLPIFAAAVPTPPTWLGALALLRIVRLFRLLKIARHLVLLFPRVIRQGAREMFFASGFVLLAVVLASSALVTFERSENPALDTFSKAFWFSVYSVVAAEPIPNPPITFGGHVAALAVILTGLFAFATVVGTISALVGERMKSGDIVMDWEDLKDHVIVCGWSRKAEIVVREYASAFPDEDKPIVVVAEFEHGIPVISDDSIRSRVQFLNDDFTKLEALVKAGVKRAARAILLSDTSRGRKERDADARTVLAALTIERLNPQVYTVAEIHRREHSHHLAMGKVNDYIVAGEHSAFLLAQSAITKGVMKVFSELLTHEHGNRFSRCHVPKSWKGKTFVELMTHMKAEHDALLVAVQEGDETVVNPKDYVFRGGEDVVLIASGEVRL